jgi:hypothetical protein
MTLGILQKISPTIMFLKKKVFKTKPRNYLKKKSSPMSNFIPDVPPGADAGALPAVAPPDASVPATQDAAPVS